MERSHVCARGVRGAGLAALLLVGAVVACGGEAGAKDAGKMRSEGRDYVVRDGDLLRFRFNVS